MGEKGEFFIMDGTSFDSLRDVEELLEYFTVAENGSKVVGVLGIRGNQDKALIETLVVDPYYQNCGVVAKLLDHVEDHVQTTVVRVVSCDSSTIEMYKKRGYTMSDEIYFTTALLRAYLSNSSFQLIDLEK